MKYLKYFLILLFIPFIVLGEECNINDVIITNIEPIKTNGNLVEKTEATAEGKKINLDLKVYEEGDSIEYKVLLKNTSNEDYYFDENSLKQDNDYMSYEFIYQDNSNIIKPKEEKELIIRVTYKNKVQEESSTGSINKTNNIVINLSNKNIINNPNTGDKIIILFSILIISLIIITISKLIKKRKYIKSLMILLPLLMIIPVTVYAICKCNIELESKIEINNSIPLYDLVQNIAKENNSCITKYDGKITDELNKTVNATNVYFNKCIDKRNIIFGGFCWQMLRTNDTKGIRMIYNGEPVDGKCLSNREDHKGIVAKNTNYTINLNNNYLYGSSFTYDITNKTFKLQNTENILWSDDTYTNILGKYTCLSDSDTCSTIYSVSDYYSNTKGYYNSYIIDDTNYASIGTSSYNANSDSLNSIGYMFNKTHSFYQKTMSNTNYLYGSSYTYNSETDTYTITGETQIIGDWQTGYDKLDNTHYTCWNTTGTCKKINFLFHTGYAEYTDYTFSSAIYIQLTKGKTVNEVVNELFYNEDLNKYNSTVKSYLENWYANNLLSYNNYIEDNVYCNDIKIMDARGFEENGVLTHRALLLDYSKEDISCNNQLHQFHTANNKAKLKYPINLLKDKEYKIISYPNNYDLFTTGKRFWVTIGNLLIDDVGRSGTINNMWYFPFSSAKSNIRPVISLKPGVTITNGTGSEENPWIIE